MKFQGFRIPEGQIRDMDYINHQTGMSKSQLVRNGLQLVINDYFQKEKIKNEQLERQKTTRATQRGEDWLSFPDGW